MEAFDNSLEHIYAHLERIDLLLQSRVNYVRVHQEVDPAFQGLYISDEELDELILQPIGLPHWANVAQQDAHLINKLEDLRTNIKTRENQSILQEKTLRLLVLKDQFQLTDFEMDVLLVCLAAELDLRYEKIYAYLQDDVTKKNPSVDLVLNLLCNNFKEKSSFRSYFNTQSSLLSEVLLYLNDDSSTEVLSLLSKHLKLDQRIIDYLMGSNELSESILPYVHLVSSAHRLSDFIFYPDIADQLKHLTDKEQTPNKRIVYLHGSYGTGKKSLIEAICRQTGHDLLSIDLAFILETESFDLRLMLRLLGRELKLKKSAVRFINFDSLLSDDKKRERYFLFETIEKWDAPIFITAKKPLESFVTTGGKILVQIELPVPDKNQRILLWSHALKNTASLDINEIDKLAESYRLTGGQIMDAVVIAKNLSNPRGEDPNIRDITEACRLNSNNNLSQYAQKLMPAYSWDDIVLPKEQHTELREIYAAIRYRSIVYQDWGFDKKLSLGKGMNILFSGSSGTGKTMAAEIMASELGLDIYKIDLSSVINKYIGETEKNLARIFKEAITSNAILFFDEADALFGRRSSVKDAHDRYANIETGYLLQRMEQYEGIVILATNLSNNMDDAFARRMTHTLSFPFPEEKERLGIWERIWPKDTPLDKDIDLEFMARKFKLSGGNIKNIALAAAFLAVMNDKKVRMKHLIQATKREFQKTGKICVKSDFEPYYSLLD